PKATARAIIRILKDRDLAKKLGEGGRKMARRYSWEKSVESLVNIWRKMLNRTL
ncbi:MAG: glycosyltransferase family 1 protein, partial [Thaumarchaeota archaeon]